MENGRMYVSTKDGPKLVERVAMEIWRAMNVILQFVCCGIDPGTIESLPWEALIYDTEGKVDVEETLYRFACRLVDATAAHVGYFKPNAAFWEKHGDPGMRALRRLVRYVHENYPQHLIVVDAKANDLGKTADDWAYKYLVWYDFDGVTVNPYMGWDCVQSFAKYKNKMVIILVRTSNPSSVSMQDVNVVITDHEIDEAIKAAKRDPAEVKNREQALGTRPYYQWVAWQVANLWNENGNCAVVIGATVPEQMAELVKLLPGIPILSPGFGAQGASVEKIIPAAIGADGVLRVIANSSSGIMYAFNDSKYEGMSWTEAAAAAAKELRDEIRKWRRVALTKRLMERVGAYLQGHFVLKAGDHAEAYLDKDEATCKPEELEEIATLTAEMLDGVDVDVVVGPAYGAISLATMVAAALNKRRGLHGDDQIISLPAMKDESGEGTGFKLRPSHAAKIKDRKVVVAEDIGTTGSSAKEATQCVGEAGGIVRAVSMIWNRGGVKAEDVGAELLLALVDEKLAKVPADDCQQCKEGVHISTNVGHGG